MGTRETSKLDLEAIGTWSTHDVDKFVSLCSDDGVWHDLGAPQPLRGKEGARQLMAAWLEAFPDMTVRQVNRVVSGDSVAAEVEFEGTNTGPLHLPDGRTVPGTGRAVKGAKGVYFARVDHGQIVEMHTYPDLAGLMGQLGLMN